MPAILGHMPDPETVRAVEDVLLSLPQVAIETHSLVHGGMCARTIVIPADTTLTGAQTNMDNICVVSGDITVTTDDGPQRITGFAVLPAKKGAKRVGMTHSETFWTTIWPTDLTDQAEIEAEMTSEADRLGSRRAIENNHTEVIA